MDDDLYANGKNALNNIYIKFTRKYKSAVKSNFA